jgi:hypothetical protein
MLDGLKKQKPEAAAPSDSSQAQPVAKNQPDSEFQKRSLYVSRKTYHRLKMKAIAENRFVWQVLDDALNQYLND